ncbi:Hsp70/Hsp90 co-chaperone cns1 [Cytospora mali]|uniref:Hsp70/Hsp90 co-chaperone cns1 n=1 Tax=Cytospora mali TaxID=578113 RepID=A0A194V0Q4_CYTMA|nr:Hsp70/Hsp90 co-chaperone cns1 [Valsa mali var. pyri (nom. inval.)]
MVHLQEITDQAESSLKISEDPTPAPPTQQQEAQPSQTQDASPPTPAGPMGPAPPTIPGPTLPPQLARSAGKTAEEIMADLNKSPLFMTELEENDDIAALQALAYEGTPLENATDFKERGNECFKEKRWRDAVEFYGRGVSLITQEERRRTRGDKPQQNDPDGDKDSEVAAQRAVLETLYVNRAACQLELKNYRSCWLDCASALKLNSRNVKAWYRSAKALLAVGRVEEADDACAGGLSVDENNAALKAVARDVIAKAEEQTRKIEAENKAKYTQQRRAAFLYAALKARNIKVRKSNRPPDMGDAKLELVPDPEDAKSTLSFPTVILYPTHYESDFIKAFNEKESLMQHFGYVFPLPWDKEGEYSANNVECFMETMTGGLVKVGKKVALLKVLCLDNVEVVDGVVKIYVVPKAKAETWVKEFKAAKEKEKAKEAS